MSFDSQMRGWIRFQPDARCATIAPVPMLLQHQEIAINEPPSSGTNSAERRLRRMRPQSQVIKNTILT